MDGRALMAICYISIRHLQDDCAREPSSSFILIGKHDPIWSTSLTYRDPLPTKTGHRLTVRGGFNPRSSLGIITQIYLTIFETCWFTTNHTTWYWISWQFTTSFVVNWGLRYCLPRARYALGLPNGYAGQLTPGRCHTSLWRDDQATLPASEPLVKPRK
jgi:hypothetical protein